MREHCSYVVAECFYFYFSRGSLRACSNRGGLNWRCCRARKLVQSGSVDVDASRSREQSHMRRCLWTETVGAKKEFLNVLYCFFSCLIRFLSPAVEDLINCELSSISVALAYLVVKKGTSGVWTVEHVGCSFSVNWIIPVAPYVTSTEERHGLRSRPETASR